MEKLIGILTNEESLQGSLSNTTQLIGKLEVPEIIQKLIGILTCEGSLQGSLSSTEQLIGELEVLGIIQTNPFEGSYEYTPTNENQTIEIEGLQATRNIIINPIPNNYGLITWDGSTLTVS